MKHLHLDCNFGAAGDMLLASLIAVGADAESIVAELGSAGLDGFELNAEMVNRCGVDSVLLTVVEKEDAHHHRHLKDMLALLNSKILPACVCESAERIFRVLAEAEAKIHGKTAETIHFHEVSGIDTAVDVIGFLLALEQLGIGSISCSRLAVGSGTLKCAHGILPLPAPATMEILACHQVPYTQLGVEGERLTPTGAAILAVMVSEFEPTLSVQPEKAGYGAGTRVEKEFPNVVRAVLGTRAGAPEEDVVTEFRLVLDDMTPEAVSFLMEQCFAAGAVEAYVVPATMKKGRLGFEMTVLATTKSESAVEECLFCHSTTFGMRKQRVGRTVLEREHIEVAVDSATVRVKIGRRRGSVLQVQPEFEDCRVAALDLDISLMEVMERASAAARDTLKS